MKFKILEIETSNIAHIQSESSVISTVQDATDLMGNANYQGANSIIISENNLDPSFFNLKTGLAGEILQKYSNYHMKLAIIGEFKKYNSNALNSFIIECNRGNHIFFVDSFQSAIKKLTDLKES